MCPNNVLPFKMQIYHCKYIIYLTSLQLFIINIYFVNKYVFFVCVIQKRLYICSITIKQKHNEKNLLQNTHRISTLSI